MIGLIIVVAFVTLLAGCSIEWTSAEVWTLHYTWDGYAEASATWTLYDNGTFVDDSGGTGKWFTSGNLFQLQYSSKFYSYTGTLYTGTGYYSSSMSGSMSGQDILGTLHNGTWYAYQGSKNVKSLDVSSTPTLSPSGEPIQ